VSGAGAEILSPECANSRLYEHLQFKFLPGYNTPDSFEWGRERKKA
jgi:hypothetical protein